jgi:Glycosyltransferases, probably involved in cell wall biogenesis
MIAVGICAYNEAGNIERAVRSVYSQNMAADKVWVVSSGSTDGTDEIVTELMKEFSSLTLIPQKGREGKNSAINLLLDTAKCDIMVLLNADNVFSSPDVLSNLLEPFSDETVGIAGGRPVPTNSTKSTAGFASALLWNMHHHISLVRPKIGELIAFRDIGTRLPTDMQSDEDILKMELEKNGFRSVYVPSAVVLNHGPETVSDFMKQRTRVNIGEMHMHRNFEYDVPTWDKRLIFNALLDAVRDMGLHPIKMLSAVAMEGMARMSAKRYVTSGGTDRNIWEQVGSTKKL